MSNPKWRERERARFDCGRYGWVAWVDEPWWHDANRPGGVAADHFAHVSPEHPEALAYTQDASKGERDIQTRIKPGRYLTRFFPELPPDVVQHWALEWSNLHAPQELRLATTPDEIERVYVNGPRSCMSLRANAYAGSCHPARVYGGGDLAVAYIQRDEEITARAIVWPSRKVYTRFYGDGDRLRPLLENAGYTEGRLNGARLLRIPAGDGFVCPYIDWHRGVDDCGTHLVIAEDGEHEVCSTEGITIDRGEPCGHCDRRRDPVAWFDCLDMSVCDDCADELLTTCEHCNDPAPSENVTIVQDGSSVCADCLENSYFHCDHCNEFALTDNSTEVDGTEVCETCFGSDFGVCEGCDTAFENDSLTDTENGVMCGDCAKAEPPDTDTLPLPLAVNE